MFRSKAAVLSIAVATAASATPPPSHTELVARTIRFGHVAPRLVVSVRPEVGVAVLQRGERGADGVVWGVELQSEVMDDAVAQSYGWRSMRWRLDIDCKARSTHVGQTEAFAEHAFAGAVHPGPMPDGWVKPTPGAFMGDVIKSVCGPARPGAPAPVTVLAQAPIAPARSPTEPIAPSKPAPPPIAPSLTPGVAPAPVRIASNGSFAAQIGAFLSAADANAAVSDAATSIAALSPLPASRIETARVHGQLFHRVLVSGFMSSEDAERFCAARRAGGGVCFVRNGRP